MFVPVESSETAIPKVAPTLPTFLQPEARAANTAHRPVGLGLMGFQDALYIRDISYASPAAVEFADESMEAISYYAISASLELARERGAYASYKGSQWDRGLLPIDTLDLLEKERGGYLSVDRSAKMDWTPIRAQLKKSGLRNSLMMAIAPTATIGNIAGITPPLSRCITMSLSKAISRANLR